MTSEKVKNEDRKRRNWSQKINLANEYTTGYIIHKSVIKTKVTKKL